MKISLKIKYTGYEDEIIQSIEAGNVSLQTSPLVGGSEALFGIKAQFKMGPFSLTTIASQKKVKQKKFRFQAELQKLPFQKELMNILTITILLIQFMPQNRKGVLQLLWKPNTAS
ncbi:MAG: hypothetical protein MZV64_46965 [Ignavibacteriales bacterium]|nr:hypothetical protein [Ignavibacteriales bacterium]